MPIFRDLLVCYLSVFSCSCENKVMIHATEVRLHKLNKTLKEGYTHVTESSNVMELLKSHAKNKMEKKKMLYSHFKVCFKLCM